MKVDTTIDGIDIKRERISLNPVIINIIKDVNEL